MKIFDLRSFGALGALAMAYILSSIPAFAADDALIAAARKEGTVTWYTTQRIDELVRPAANAFEKKYGIKVNYVRASTADVALRIYQEGVAHHMAADVFDASGAGENLKKANLVLKWLPDSAKKISSDYIDPQGYWVATQLYALVPSFNTDLVHRGTEPKTFEDLLDPRWKDKMTWNSGVSAAGAPGFVGLVLHEMGEDKGTAYLRALAKQNVAGSNVLSAEVVSQVVAGEYAIGLQTFANQPASAAATGAPVGWIPMQPVMVIFSVLSVTNGAPHPNAGKLLADFLISEEGQRIYRDGGLVPVHPKVEPADPSLRPDGTRLRGEFFSPSQVEAQMPHWVKVFQDIFR